jgi:glucose-6-phosphate 1-dehydrogenase
LTAVRENPFAEGLRRLPVEPTTLVIFGAAGDLARRKLLPAVYNLAHEGSLPQRFNMIGFGREGAERDFRDLAAQSIQQFSRRSPDQQVLDALLEHVTFVPGNFEEPRAYERLAETAASMDRDANLPFNRLFYLSTAPSFFPIIATALGSAGLHRREGADVRLVIEKPFGSDLESARGLNQTVLDVFEEQQVYRIDHYLGKETVQNILAFRFANGIFEPVWNRNFIDHIQITAAEDIGIEGRAAYYDGSGALRDLIQNHLLQLLALICMEPPMSFSADQLRDEKVKVMRAIRRPTLQDVPRIAARAQYGQGAFGGEEVPAYLEEAGVPQDSTTETYAALKLELSNARWSGVPFFLRTGKRLARKVTEIAVTLKLIPHLALEQAAGDGANTMQPNRLVLSVQPDEGVSLSLAAKVPGTRMSIRPVNMEFRYGTSFLSESPEAYERLILDAMRGDATLFTRNDEVEAAWAICDPIVKAWEVTPGPLPTYRAGSEGPVEAEGLLHKTRAWRPI